MNLIEMITTKKWVITEKLTKGWSKDVKYYLLYLNGSSKQDLHKQIKQNYGYNLPSSVVLFELANNEKNMIVDYNNWLLNKFLKKEIPKITKEDLINILN